MENTTIRKIIFLSLLALLSSCGASDMDDNVIQFTPFANKSTAGTNQLSKSSELIILIPDTQLYVVYKEYRPLLERMIDRILEIQDNGYEVKAVLQVGDITEKNTDEEWRSVHRIYSKLHDKIDYIFCTGNHDYGEEGEANNRNTGFNNYFRYEANGFYVTSYEKDRYDNSYFHFDIHGHPFQLFSLEFGPRDGVVNWARNLASHHPEKIGILLTHAYLTRDAKLDGTILRRFDFAEYGWDQSVSPFAWGLKYPELGGVNDGQQLWDKLIKKNNFKFVLSGHKNIADKLISTSETNEEVLQMIFAEHKIPEGAVDGWIQILEFYEDEKTVGVKTYSTLLNTWKTDSIHQYEFTYR